MLYSRFVFALKKNLTKELSPIYSTQTFLLIVLIEQMSSRLSELFHYAYLGEISEMCWCILSHKYTHVNAMY
jgi:hypothetical protein